MSFTISTTNATQSIVINPKNDQAFTTFAAIAVGPSPGMAGGVITLTAGAPPAGVVGVTRVTIRSGGSSGFLDIPLSPTQTQIIVQIRPNNVFEAAATVAGRDHHIGPFPIGGRPATFVDLPAKTQVRVSGRTNARKVQRATLLLDEGPQYAWEGSGEGAPFVDAAITTPSSPLLGGRIRGAIVLENAPSKDGPFAQSKTLAGRLDLGPLHERVVIAEDATDGDYNDCIFRLSWFQAHWL